MRRCVLPKKLFSSLLHRLGPLASDSGQKEADPNLGSENAHRRRLLAEPRHEAGVCRAKKRIRVAEGVELAFDGLDDRNIRKNILDSAKASTPRADQVPALDRGVFIEPPGTSW